MHFLIETPFKKIKNQSPCRVNQASTVVDNLIYSFGGYCQQTTVFELKHKSPIDVHVLNTLTFKWHKRPVPKENEPEYTRTPYFRYGHTCVTYEGRIYLWGGRADWTNHLCNQIYVYEPKVHAWTKLEDVRGEVPDGRDGHSACVVNRSMFIFGGYVQRVKKFSNDLYEFNFNSHEWNLIVPKVYHV